MLVQLHRDHLICPGGIYEGPFGKLVWLGPKDRRPGDTCA